MSIDDARGLLRLWLRVEPLAHYRLTLRAATTAGRTRSRSMSRRGGAASTPCSAGPGSVELAALVHPPSPWDDAMFEVLAAADAAGSPDTPPLPSSRTA